MVCACPLSARLTRNTSLVVRLEAYKGQGGIMRSPSSLTPLTPCVAFASHVDPVTTIVIVLLCHRHAAFILQPLQEESSRAPCRNKPPSTRTRDIHSHPLLAYWTLLQNRSRDHHIHSLLPQGTCFLLGYGVPGSGSGAGFPQRSIHNVIRWRRLYGSLFKCWPIIRLH